MFNYLTNLFKNKEQISEPLSYAEIPSKQTHLYSIIWLHGLGASGNDSGIATELKLKKQANIRFIFPHAPMREMMTNGEQRVTMRSWYDISEIVLNARADYNGINQSAASLHQLIEQEIAAGIASENILLIGFSQGGCIALHTGLCFHKRLAGIIGLSTYLSTVDKLGKQANAVNFDTPILMAHGTEDTSVAIEHGRAAFNALHSRHYPIQWHEYPMGHQFCKKEIIDVSSFINQVFN
jgi:phospholipase/carboxylesterase